MFLLSFQLIAPIFFLFSVIVFAGSVDLLCFRVCVEEKISFVQKKRTVVFFGVSVSIRMLMRAFRKQWISLCKWSSWNKHPSLSLFNKCFSISNIPFSWSYTYRCRNKITNEKCNASILLLCQLRSLILWDQVFSAKFGIEISQLVSKHSIWGRSMSMWLGERRRNWYLDLKKKRDSIWGLVFESIRVTPMRNIYFSLFLNNVLYVSECSWIFSSKWTKWMKSWWRLKFIYVFILPVLFSEVVV